MILTTHYEYLLSPRSTLRTFLPTLEIVVIANTVGETRLPTSSIYLVLCRTQQEDKLQRKRGIIRRDFSQLA